MKNNKLENLFHSVFSYPEKVLDAIDRIGIDDFISIWEG